MGFDLRGKVALVTGATSGMGRATAYQLADCGANVILLGRRNDRLAEISLDLAKKFNILTYQLCVDIQHQTLVKESFSLLPENFKHIDILINAAGVALDKNLIQDGLVESWNTMIDTNVKGLLNVTHEILPDMVKRDEGHIVNIGSTAGHEYMPTGNIYCATKHAVKAITKSLRLDLLGSNIRVTEISPGSTQTEFNEVRLKSKELAEKHLKLLKLMILLMQFYTVLLDPNMLM